MVKLVIETNRFIYRKIENEDAKDWFMLLNRVWRNAYKDIFPEEVFIEKDNKIDEKIKEIVDSNIFFNYAVKVLIQDCILPVLNLQENDEQIEFIISIDNRNIRVGELNNLETYLKTEFCIYDDDFEITYYDSKTNYGIQLADLTVNTFYNSYKDISIVENLIKELKPKNFRVSLFPRNSGNKK